MNGLLDERVRVVDDKQCPAGGAPDRERAEALHALRGRHGYPEDRIADGELRDDLAIVTVADPMEDDRAEPGFVERDCCGGAVDP